MEASKMLYSIKTIQFPKEIKDKIDLENRKSDMERFVSETILRAQH